MGNHIPKHTMDSPRLCLRREVLTGCQGLHSSAWGRYVVLIAVKMIDPGEGCWTIKGAKKVPGLLPLPPATHSKASEIPNSEGDVSLDVRWQNKLSGGANAF